MTANSTAAKPVLLIYIPCHKDYEMAFENARKLYLQQASPVLRGLEIKVFISINGVKNFTGPNDLPFLQISHIQEVLGADGNIAKGFVTGLEQNPDYLWILSANEELTEHAVDNLEEMILQNPEADLFIANAANRKGSINLHNVFCGLPPQLALGLISGVIYNFHSTKGSFLQSTLFSWTGWGQLAVIQDFLASNRDLVVIEFPDSDIYGIPYTYSPDAKIDVSERTIVSNLYSHSFFGLPVLAYCLLQTDTKLLKQFQKEWLLHNWFKINLFSHKATFGDELTLKRNGWIRDLAQTTFKTWKGLQLWYFLSKSLPTERLQYNSNAIKILSRYKDRI